MSQHEGVSCDCCLKSSFRGRRYKCLVCFDFDLCASCYESGSTNSRHSTQHPVQCILTRNDYELFYGGEAITIDQPQSLTCPICGKMGLTEMALQEHVTTEHSDNSAEVVCPLCASIPGGEANNVTDDFASHLTLEHRTPRELISFGDERQPTTSIRGGRRGPHPVRNMTNPRNRRSHGGSSSAGQSQMSSSAAAAAAAAAAGLPGISPSGTGIGSSGLGIGGSGLGVSARDSMDPISELLSQLSGVRRAANLGQSSSTTHSHLQQLQIQMERHASASNQNTGRGLPFSERSSIDRALRRHQQITQHQAHAQNLSGLISGQSSNGQSVIQVGGAGGAIGLISSSSLGNGASSGHLNSGSPFMSILDPPTGLSSGISNGLSNGLGGQSSGQSATLNNANIVGQNGSGNASSSKIGNNNANNPQFLLSKISDQVLSESEQQAAEIHRADRSLFVQELLLSTLAENIDLSGEYHDDDSETGASQTAGTANGASGGVNHTPTPVGYITNPNINSSLNSLQDIPSGSPFTKNAFDLFDMKFRLNASGSANMNNNIHNGSNATNGVNNGHSSSENHDIILNMSPFNVPPSPSSTGVATAPPLLVPPPLEASSSSSLPSSSGGPLPVLIPGLELDPNSPLTPLIPSTNNLQQSQTANNTSNGLINMSTNNNSSLSSSNPLIVSNHSINLLPNLVSAPNDTALGSDDRPLSASALDETTGQDGQESLADSATSIRPNVSFSSFDIDSLLANCLDHQPVTTREGGSTPPNEPNPPSSPPGAVETK